MLYAFLVRFRPDPDTHIRQYTGFRLAAALLEIIEFYDPELSKLLHESSPWPRGTKPYTVSAAEWVRDKREAPRRGGQAQFRVTLLNDSLIGPVMSAISQFRSQFEPFERPGPIEHIDMDQRRGRWTGVSDPASLLATAPEEEIASVFVASPTAFQATGRRRGAYVCKPEPALIVGSLVAKWAAYGGQPLDPDLVQRLKDALEVTRSRVRNRSVAAGRQHLEGFTGRVQLEAPDIETGRLLQALLAFAFYSGLGIKTAEGMGQTLPLYGRMAPWDERHPGGIDELRDQAPRPPRSLLSP